MRYEQTKKLSNREFKRLVGVQRRTFDEMVNVMLDTVNTKETSGCPPKLDLADQNLICLQYWHLGVNKSYTLCYGRYLTLE